MAKSKNSDTNVIHPRHDCNADRIKIHLGFLARRFEGGAPPTPEAYARALRQWQQLPGAVAGIGVPMANLTQGQAAPTPVGTNELALASDAAREQQP
jgi:hypothetical protein